MNKFIAAGVAALAVSGGTAWYLIKKSSSAPQYRTAKAEKGDIFVTVTATGTVQPVTQVQVGTQVSGTILKLHADFNVRVAKGQLVAEIDPAQFQARVDQDQANLDRAIADVKRVEAGLVQAEKELKRSEDLFAKKLISESDRDAAVATRDSLLAQKAVAEEVVKQSRAALKSSQVNLDYTKIVSPIEGVVISRSVDVGQTVAASLQAPTIFVIADSLKRIQIQASVAEADIGKIVKGQDVTFAVDAFREMTFKGNVSQVRLAPTTIQNVVTYTVIIDAENPEEKLMPGMTANVTFQISRHENVLRVPNAALRFTPPSELSSEKETPRKEGRAAMGRVWIQTGNGPLAVEVLPGASDGSFTEIKKGDLAGGQEVITGLVQDGKDAPMSNPFSPGRPGGGPARR